MVCNGCNDCDCKEVDVVSSKTKTQLEEKLRVFNDLVCVVANTNCLEFPKAMGKAIYLLWCYLKDLTNLIVYLIDRGGGSPYDDTALKARITALEGRQDKDTDTVYDDTSVRNRLTTLENENLALKRIITNLEASGAWSGGITGNFRPNRNIATGNINIFGGTADGNSFIRTNSGQTENDLAGGV